MYVARLIIAVFLILAILVTTSPLGGTVHQFWMHARPGVLFLMDSVYTAVRNFVAGTGSQDGVDDDAPGVDFEIIITGKSGAFL